MMRLVWTSMMLLMLGCSIVRERADTEQDNALFPHPDEMESGLVHGAMVFDNDVSDCEQCHKQGNEQARPCASCHENYPHESGWIAGAVHGHEEGCEDCHDAPGLKATGEYGCASCHASYPHQVGWVTTDVHAPHTIGSMLGQTHGVYAMERGGPEAVCGPCHGDDLSGGGVEVGCTECHAEYPHESGWGAGTAHGAASQELDAGCDGCHDADATSVDVTCSQCHAVYPHPAGWSLSHLGSADQLGEEGCMGCHEAGDGPSTMVSGCATQCHGGDE